MKQVRNILLDIYNVGRFRVDVTTTFTAGIYICVKQVNTIVSLKVLEPKKFHVGYLLGMKFERIHT